MIAAPSIVEDELAAAEERPKFARGLVQEVLFELYGYFDPAPGWQRPRARCERIAAVGGYRRGKRLMKDLELLYVSRVEQRRDPGALFESMTAEVDLTEELLEELVSDGVLEKRLNKNGVLSAWGSWNKHAVHVATGLPIDLFRATEESWHNRMVVTTGPRELNIAIAQLARQKAPAFEWEVAEAGFVPLGTTWAEAEKTRRVMRSEAEVFSFVGLPLVKPEERAALAVAAGARLRGNRG